MPVGGAIGAYRVLDTIGQGGMGTVYLGEHVLLGRRAAIKVLRPALSADETIVKRFFNEARAVTRIADPGIVQVFDFGYHTDGSAFIVMELLEGETLNRRLRRLQRFGVAECLRLVRMVCTSLAAAHAKGIVHRDLKPANIFIVGDPAVVGGERAKILDFGIAKLSGDDPDQLRTQTGMMMGTPVYMSPEQCRGAGEVDPRADVYAIGCVMFAMLTGRPPFVGKGPGDVIAAHLREPPPLASSRAADLPPMVDSLLARCLRKSPADRFQSMTELVDAIATVEQALGSSTAVPAPQRAAPVVPSTTPAPQQTMPIVPPTTPTSQQTTPIQPSTTPAPQQTTPIVQRAAHPTQTAAAQTAEWLHAAPTVQTTLTTANGQSRAQAAARTPRWIAVLVGAVAISLFGFLALRDGTAGLPATPGLAGHRSSEIAAPGAAAVMPAVTEPGAPTVPGGAVDVDAPVAPAPTAAAVDAAVAATAIAVDAAVENDHPDAAIARTIDAPAPRPHRPRPEGPPRATPSTAGEHARKTGSAAPPIIDRGD